VEYFPVKSANYEKEICHENIAEWVNLEENIFIDPYFSVYFTMYSAYKKSFR